MFDGNDDNDYKTTFPPECGSKHGVISVLSGCHVGWSPQVSMKRRAVQSPNEGSPRAPPRQGHRQFYREPNRPVATGTQPPASGACPREEPWPPTTSQSPVAIPKEWCLIGLAGSYFAAQGCVTLGVPTTKPGVTAFSTPLWGADCQAKPAKMRGPSSVQNGGRQTSCYRCAPAHPVRCSGCFPVLVPAPLRDSGSQRRLSAPTCGVSGSFSGPHPCLLSTYQPRRSQILTVLPSCPLCPSIMSRQVTPSVSGLSLPIVHLCH